MPMVGASCYPNLLSKVFSHYHLPFIFENSVTILHEPYRTRRQVRRQPTTATSVDIDGKTESRRPVSYCWARAACKAAIKRRLNYYTVNSIASRNVQFNTFCLVLSRLFYALFRACVNTIVIDALRVWKLRVISVYRHKLNHSSYNRLRSSHYITGISSVR